VRLHRRLAKDAPDAVAANYHGLCNGRTSAGPDDPGITDWLHDTLQALGGRNDDGVDQETRARSCRLPVRLSRCLALFADQTGRDAVPL
jgi:hypothetical protein